MREATPKPLIGKVSPYRNPQRKVPAAYRQVALPAPPGCDAVQCVPLQFMVITEQIHRHLIPLGLTEPGDYDALGPEGR